MPTLNWNEIRTRAAAFAKDWANEDSERAEAQSFWNEFFEVFGVKRRRVAVFEKQAVKLPNGGKTAHGRIDLFWPGTLLAEHKSAGRDLSAAFTQALDYFHGLPENEVPRYVVVSDFARMRLFDLENDGQWEFLVAELLQHIERFSFIAGYEKQRIRDEDPINERAVQVNVDQCYGIEIEEFPAQIAQVALWLTDHQMNVEAGVEFGAYFNRIPLTTSASIRYGNALRLDWEAFVPSARLSYMLGNPPFIGKQFQSAAQKEDPFPILLCQRAIRHNGQSLYG